VGPEPPPLGGDDRLIAEDHGTYSYVVFGGAKFLVPGLPWRNLTDVDIFRVPDGALLYDKTLPADGTVLQADSGPGNSPGGPVFVVFGGVLFEIPGLPWPGGVAGTSAGSVGGVNIVPLDSLLGHG
jgi:hypothetical protein